MSFLNALPGAIAEGLIWGLMAIGVYISYKILDIADLTVDGSICTGACVCAVLLTKGVPAPLCVIVAFFAGALTGVLTGLFHTSLGIPSILAGILTLALQNCTAKMWLAGKSKLSLILNAVGVILFVVSRQPYAGVFLFVFLVIKAIILYGKQ